jgi:hypothetical protein
MNKNRWRVAPALGLAGAVAVIVFGSGGCSVASNVAQAAIDGCNEFPSQIDGVQLSGDAYAFVHAGADLVNIAGTLENDVLTACEGIANDLGATDTWTAMGPNNGGSTQAEMQQACSAANDAIKKLIGQGGSVTANCALAVQGGQCTVDADVEAKCEASCSGMASCTPPMANVSCSPGDLSVMCQGSCSGGATCEGTGMVQATCQGSCQADCTGTCTPPTAAAIHCEGSCAGNCNGTCTVNGTATQTTGTCSGTCSGTCDAVCTYTPGSPGHCEGTCNGSCSGNCVLSAKASVMCGANVRCKGGCMTNYTAPQCEGQVTPAMCSSSVNCQAACQSHADFQATCTKPSATLECSASTDPNVQKLEMTLATNLPKLINAAKIEGPLAETAIATLGNSGQAIVNNLGTQGGKALACANAALDQSVNAVGNIQASVSVSVTVTATASANSG